MSRPPIRPSQGGGSRASQGSFHAGAPIPTLAGLMRRQSTHRYQTFPTPPPKTPLDQPRMSELVSESDGSASGPEDDEENENVADEVTPLPVRQLLLLAFLSLSEQTALNSISPYLPEMVESMPGLPHGQRGLYVGILASAFALAQLSTNFLWGYASDVVGRKPILLLGTFSLMCCFCVFGLCKQYWQVVVVHVAMGLFNGNAACVPTVLGEVTDRSNQSRAFTYLPVIYSLGGITGPALGGILVGKMGKQYPYLGPNVLGAAMLAASCIIVAIWFEETLDESEAVPFHKPAWLSRLLSWLPGRGSDSPSKPPLSRNRSWSARWPRGPTANRPLLADESDDGSDDGEHDDDDAENNDTEASSKSAARDGTPWKELLNRTTLTLLFTYLVFQLSNISFNSLYPIFASSEPPAGRGLGPGKIGVSQSLAGVATIVFQAFLFKFVNSRLGNLGTYRYSLLGIAVSLVLMPWVGYVDSKPLFGVGNGRIWLYIEIGLVLIVKNVCAVAGLSSVMLLVSA